MPDACISWFCPLWFGHNLFFHEVDTNFSIVGLTNRITIASSLGAAFVLVAIVGLASSLLRSNLARALVFSLAIGAICGVIASS